MTVFFVGLGVLLILFFSEPALAWGPATHLYYGFNVLNHLGQVCDVFRAILSVEPKAFLYGCVGADIVLAKKLGPRGSHGHRWDNALKLYDEAKTPRTQAFSLGYLCHLAADTISHNSYVPSKTVESFQSGVLKHLYWELRFDRRLTSEKTLRAFEDIARSDFSDCDEHMEQLIPVRILNFSANKRVFNQILILQGLRQWQTLLTNMGQSRVHFLTDQDVDYFVDKALKAVFSFFEHGHQSKTVSYDPIGQVRLYQANTLRRHYWMQQKLHRSLSVEMAQTVANQFRLTADQPIHIENYKIH